MVNSPGRNKKPETNQGVKAWLLNAVHLSHKTQHNRSAYNRKHRITSYSPMDGECIQYNM